ncbi:uncharacterized protein MELLADRAFT_105122 [Melampsora larici-populina 98AG31]|uniref:Uncharacterized protein n=1 Tax=Melampsora larici-populina (strain 98AG31 / pathotype 3-4-7) TaxID=747676 RepID=F4RHH4_MELLP|nr:uncharacterized protein MELLADRAFT_105122 [Melampsora larici-populina 98AG31]EGG08173.1 hypothetical protein MELLADRAFT_105122 [Melampsora larici-populina 98AG31]
MSSTKSRAMRANRRAQGEIMQEQNAVPAESSIDGVDLPPDKEQEVGEDSDSGSKLEDQREAEAQDKQRIKEDQNPLNNQLNKEDSQLEYKANESNPEALDDPAQDFVESHKSDPSDKGSTSLSSLDSEDNTGDSDDLGSSYSSEDSDSDPSTLSSGSDSSSNSSESGNSSESSSHRKKESKRRKKKCKTEKHMTKLCQTSGVVVVD